MNDVDPEKLPVIERVRRFTGFSVIDPDRAPDGFGHTVPDLENAANLLKEGKVKQPRHRLSFEDWFLVGFAIVCTFAGVVVAVRFL